MSKQIIYPGLISRIFSTTLDLMLLAICATPVTRFLAKQIFIFNFKDFLAIHQVDQTSNEAMEKIFSSDIFIEYLTLGKAASYFGQVFSMQVMIIGGYFLFFWLYKNATPGKLILGMRIADSISFGKPTKMQLIRRFFAYPTALIGLWFIIFSKQKQALHDKIAGTVVIKK